MKWLTSPIDGYQTISLFWYCMALLHNTRQNYMQAYINTGKTSQVAYTKATPQNAGNSHQSHTSHDQTTKHWIG